MDECVPAHFQGKKQVILGLVTPGKAILDCWVRLTVVQTVKYTITVDNCDGSCELCIEGPPDVAGAFIKKPLPITLRPLGNMVLEGGKEVAIE